MMPVNNCRDDVHSFPGPKVDVPTPALCYRDASERKRNPVDEEQQPVVKYSEKKLKCKYSVP